MTTSEERVAFTKARDAFEAWPSNAAAAAFMKALMEREAEGDISDDTWLNGLAAILEYLETSG